MTVRTFLLLTLFAVGARAHVWAQHDSHQPAAEDEASLAQCAQVQPVVQRLIDDASLRLEGARQTNSVTAMRAAVDDVEGALRDLRAQLAPCAKTHVIDPHTGHAMPSTPAPMAPTSPATAVAGDPHAGHAMPSPAKPASPVSKPPAAKPSAAKPPTAPDPHAGHVTPPAAKPAPSSAKPAQAAPAPAKPQPTDSHAGHDLPAAKPEAATDTGTTQATDPVCGLKVDPASAPSVRHAEQTFHFCSEQHRESFEKSPAKYLPKKE